MNPTPTLDPATKYVALDPTQFNAITVGVVLVLVLLAAVFVAQLRKP